MGASWARGELTYRVVAGQNGVNKVGKLTLVRHRLSSTRELGVVGAATTMAGSNIERAATTYIMF